MSVTPEQRQAMIDCLDELLVDFNPDLVGCSFADLFGVPTELCATHAEGFVGGADAQFGQRHNATVITKVSTGIYQVLFDTPHTRADYPVTFGGGEPGNTRAGYHTKVVNGTQDANGFQFWHGRGDNGGAPQILADLGQANSGWVSFRVGGVLKGVNCVEVN